MFKPGSNQRDYSLCSQYDDALDLSDIPELSDDADDAARAARDAVIADRIHRLKVAHQTSDFSSLVKPGQKPMIFHFRHIRGDAVDWWHGLDVGDLSKEAMLFRLAIKSVENFDIKLKFIDADGEVPRRLHADSLAEIYAMGNGIGRHVVRELADIIARKTFMGVDPL